MPTLPESPKKRKEKRKRKNSLLGINYNMTAKEREESTQPRREAAHPESRRRCWSTEAASHKNQARISCKSVNWCCLLKDPGGRDPRSSPSCPRVGKLLCELVTRVRNNGAHPNFITQREESANTKPAALRTSNTHAGSHQQLQKTPGRSACSHIVLEPKPRNISSRQNGALQRILIQLLGVQPSAARGRTQHLLGGGREFVLGESHRFI